MNVLSHVHIHRIPNPSGVGRVIDSILPTHDAMFPGAHHRMLVCGAQYDKVYLQLSDYWKMQSFVPHTSSTFWQQARWVWRNQPLAEEYWSEVDIVYGPAESYVSTKRAKLICTIHDVAGFESDLYPNTTAQKAHRRKWRILFRQMGLHADAIVTVSNYSAARIAHFFPRLEKKLTVIPNAPHSIFGALAEEVVVEEVRQLSGNSPFILMPGGLSLRKNANLILKVIPRLARELPDVKLVVSGSNAEVYCNRLKALNCANVVLAGYVSDELLNALCQRAALVWFPSRYEGFGMPVVEAMAAGAPVVASRVASIPEVAGDAALLCDVDDDMEHLEAIRFIMESSKVRHSFSELSRKQAERFSWGASAQKLETLFQSL